MKTLRIVLLASIILAIAIVIGWRVEAQTTNSKEDRGALGKYEDMMLYLSQHADSNTVAHVTEYIRAAQLERNATEAGLNTRLLNDLRMAKTNEAIRLLEVQLDGALIVLGDPEFKRDPKYDVILKRAQEYRAKYPHKSGSAEVDAAIARTFDSLKK